MNDTVKRLEEARALIARPDGWTQGAWARRGDGVRICNSYEEVSAKKNAVCWCAHGALAAAGCPWMGREAAFLRQVIGHWITDWNDADGRTQEEIIAAFDRAIALAKAEAP